MISEKRVIHRNADAKDSLQKTRFMFPGFLRQSICYTALYFSAFADVRLNILL